MSTDSAGLLLLCLAPAGGRLCQKPKTANLLSVSRPLANAPKQHIRRPSIAACMGAHEHVFLGSGAGQGITLCMAVSPPELLRGLAALLPGSAAWPPSASATARFKRNVRVAPRLRDAMVGCFPNGGDAVCAGPTNTLPSSRRREERLRLFSSGCNAATPRGRVRLIGQL